MNYPYRNSKSREAAARYWGKSLEKPDWYTIKAQEDDALEVLIYDVIGWPYTDVSELVRQLAEARAKKITLRINSPGGDVFDGLALFNSLRDHPAQKITRIEGMAASIASVVALAGDEVTAHKSAMYMIHEPWAAAIGDQHLLREVAEVLEKISGNLLNIYYDKTGKDKRRLKQEMENETWFTAEEALDRGLIDRVLDEPAAKAAFDLSMYAHAPDGIHPEGRDLTDREIEKALRDAGASRSFAKSVISRDARPVRDAWADSCAELVRQNIAEMQLTNRS